MIYILPVPMLENIQLTVIVSSGPAAEGSGSSAEVHLNELNLAPVDKGFGMWSFVSHEFILLVVQTPINLIKVHFAGDFWLCSSLRPLYGAFPMPIKLFLMVGLCSFTLFI